jgi:hypothetical protein
LDIATVENEFLAAAVYPSSGLKIFLIVDKPFFHKVIVAILRRGLSLSRHARAFVYIHIDNDV